MMGDVDTGAPKLFLIKLPAQQFILLSKKRKKDEDKYMIGITLIREVKIAN